MAADLNWGDCPLLESVPGKVSGAWVFKGTRVPVGAVLANLEDMDIAEVAAAFPPITADQVREVLRFLAKSTEPALPALS